MESGILQAHFSGIPRSGSLGLSPSSCEHPPAASGTPDPSNEAATEAARLFDTHGNAIFRLAYSYMHNKHDAEDVLQDTLIQFLRTRPTLTGAEHEKAWLMRVAANTSKNRLKSQRIRQADNVDELGDSLASEDSSDLSFVWEAVRDLPVQQREVIHLFYQEGYSIKEIARILDRSATTVRSDMFRGRNKLRKILKEAYDFE